MSGPMSAAADPPAPVVAPVMPNVPIGPTTIAGTGITITALVGAILAAVTGNGDSQLVELIVAGVVLLASSSITLIGRYAQAKILAQKTPGA